jgi:hypothetical protein
MTFPRNDIEKDRFPIQGNGLQLLFFIIHHF